MKVHDYIERFFKWIDNYTGFGAPFVKAIPFLLISCLIFYLFWSWSIFMKLGLSYGRPLCYLFLLTWFSQPVIVALGVYLYFRSERKLQDYY